MSSPPWSESRDRAGLLQRPVPWSVGSRWPQALVPVSPAAPRQGLRLGDSAILSWPATACGQGMGGGPLWHAWLTELEPLADPSTPRLATPHRGSYISPRI